jgi:hypothetical protein
VTAPGVLLRGRYELLHPLGDADRVTVWEARDTALDRRVEIRLLRPELARDPAAAERFRADARAGARSDSWDRPRVLDAGDDAGIAAPFVVLEWRDASLSPTLAADPPARYESPGRPAAATPASPRGVGQAGDNRAEQADRRRRLALPLVVAGVLAISAIVAGRAAFAPASGGDQATGSLSEPPPVATSASSQPVQREATAPASQGSTPVPTAPGPSATLAPAAVRRHVANTDGQGVALRASPGGQRLPGKGYDEGAVVTELERRGAWAHIRGDDGREGWVLAVTLVP